LKWIDQARPQGSVNNQVTVVFDGHPEHFGSSHQGDIRVIFSDGCSADDTIKRMVEEDADHKNCMVVSNDKDIFIYARSLGARIMSVEAFTSHRAPRQGKSPNAKAGLSLSSQEKINKELGSLWLKEKK
jgi:predicted RNA-binding protein with PIN domain